MSVESTTTKRKEEEKKEKTRLKIAGHGVQFLRLVRNES
jgi:hypothetical protein